MKKLLLALALVVSPAAHALEPVKSTGHQVLYRAQGEFAEVKENLRLAIQNQGLVVTYVARVGEMLERTGKDLGVPDNVYAEADVMAFCSATLTRDMVRANPANLVFCPYAVHVYELNDEPGMVYVGYRRPAPAGDDASRAALAAIDELMQGIVEEALAW